MLPPHVDLIEGGQHGAGVLGLLQSLGDPQPHAVHLHLQEEDRGGTGGGDGTVTPQRTPPDGTMETPPEVRRLLYSDRTGGPLRLSQNKYEM